MAFIHKQVDSGRYASTSEVIRDALRLAKECAVKIEALRAALTEGEESGPAEDFDLKAFFAEMHVKHNKNVA